MTLEHKRSLRLTKETFLAGLKLDKEAYQTYLKMEDKEEWVNNRLYLKNRQVIDWLEDNEINHKLNKLNKPDKPTFEIKAKGGVYNNELVLLPLGEGRYIYNFRGKICLTNVILKKEKGKEEEYSLLIEDNEYIFKDKSSNTLPYYVPGIEEIKSFLEGKFKVMQTEKLYDYCFKIYSTLFDIKDRNYLHILVLATFQSWLIDFLEVVFYIGLDAKYGSGKTTILEDLIICCKNGMLLEASKSGNARTISKFGLSVGCDEIDVLSKSQDNEIYSLFRKGYRRNNPFVRLKERSYDPEIFDIFSFKAYTYQSEVENALKSRGFNIPLQSSRDNTLPILNTHKATILKDIQDQFFFWYVTNSLDMVCQFAEFGLFRGFSYEDFEKDNNDIFLTRKRLYSLLTQHLSSASLEVLESLSGRNTELSYIALSIAKALNVDISQYLKPLLENKQAQERDTSDNEYLELLKESVIEAFNTNKESSDYFLKSGEFEGLFYYPYSMLKKEFRQECFNLKYRIFDEDSFKKWLKELGFNKGINITLQKVKISNNKINLCMIYDPDVLERLDITFKRKVEQKQLEIESYQDFARSKLDTETDRNVFVGLLVSSKGLSYQEAQDVVTKLLQDGEIMETKPGYLLRVEA